MVGGGAENRIADHIRSQRVSGLSSGSTQTAAMLARLGEWRRLIGRGWTGSGRSRDAGRDPQTQQRPNDEGKWDHYKYRQELPRGARHKQLNG